MGLQTRPVSVMTGQQCLGQWGGQGRLHTCSACRCVRVQGRGVCVQGSFSKTQPQMCHPKVWDGPSPQPAGSQSGTDSICFHPHHGSLETPRTWGEMAFFIVSPRSGFEEDPLRQLGTQEVRWTVRRQGALRCGLYRGRGLTTNVPSKLDFLL